jgi:hexosaminidase
VQLKNVLGVQANIWTETIATDQRLQFLLFPRIAALAESGWTNPQHKNEKNFNSRLKSHLRFYKTANIYYYNPFEPLENKEKIDFKSKKEMID